MASIERSLIFGLHFAAFIVAIHSAKLKTCTDKDFGVAFLRCDPVNRTRSYVYFMQSYCEINVTGGFVPKPKHGLPCDCPPGQGLSEHVTEDIECQKCQPGSYSVGGELIDNWRNWNGSISIPGHGYKLHVFCSHILTGNSCSGWRPSDDFTYIVSGPFLNATAERSSQSCLEQRNIMGYRIFVNPDGENFVSFRYKVNGILCSRRLAKLNACTNGLYFYIDGKRIFHSDLQFKWIEKKYNLTRGTHSFRWVYQTSCKRTASLDVAYIQHLAFTGAEDPETKCRKCPTGTYTNSKGSSECTKCAPGTYQNLTGQTECSHCPPSYYSRLGEESCNGLPPCTSSDFSLVLDPVDECKHEKDDTFTRKQTKELPIWPGFKTGSCVESGDTTSVNRIPCSCQPGYRITSLNTTSPEKIRCIKCLVGKFSPGNETKCYPCKKMFAAVPGIYIKEWPRGVLPHDFTSGCTGQYCLQSGGWQPAGDFIRTSRIPGDFETYLEIKDVVINYGWPQVRFQCAVDCRVFPDQKKLANFNDCFMRFTIVKNGVVIKERDCVRSGREQDRNGTLQSHYYPLTSTDGVPSNYTFRWLFHHGDEPNATLFSYEARLYNVDIWGVAKGSAKTCTTCPPGTKVSADGSLCVNCPPGTFRGIGDDDCRPCPRNTFSDKNGSKECINCGHGTVSFENGTGCDINKCQFIANPLTHYDLSPLSRPGGPMYEVRLFDEHKKPSIRWYRLRYFINLCTTHHDNSSCIYQKSYKDAQGKYTIKRTTMIKTMACRRWSFDRNHGYNIGRVIGFKMNKTNIAGGFIVELTDGDKCYNKNLRKLIKSKTTIKMICDLYAGAGEPTPVSDKMAVDINPCQYNFKWRSRYACPICKSDGVGKQVRMVYHKCVNGFMNVTIVPNINCIFRPNFQAKFKRIKCMFTDKNLSVVHTVHTGLIAVIVVFFLFMGILGAVVVVLCKRNKYYRSQLFSPGTAMTQLKDADDLQELVAD